MQRNILHINIVNFYIAVAQALNPKLRSYPVAVATNGAVRRVILDVSARAREAGIYRGMLLDTAKRKCPDLVALDPAPYEYRRATNALMSEGARFSPRVEPAGPGHVFIDLTGTTRLFGRSIDVADRFRKQLKTKFRLENAAGLGTNKLVSKVATRVIKPAGLCTVMAGCEQSFMSPLPINLMPGIDYTIIRQLYQFNLRFINEILKINQDTLAQAVGPVAGDIFRISRGIDTVPVREQKEPEPCVETRKVLHEHTNDNTLIQKELFCIISQAGAQLRKQGLGARRLHLTLTYYDSLQYSRTVSLPSPLNGDLSLFEQFRKMLFAVNKRRIRVSNIEIRLTELSYPYGQLDLFSNQEKEDNLMKVMDSVRNKYGEKVLGFYGVPGRI